MKFHIVELLLLAVVVVCIMLALAVSVDMVLSTTADPAAIMANRGGIREYNEEILLILALCFSTATTALWRRSKDLEEVDKIRRSFKSGLPL